MLDPGECSWEVHIALLASIGLDATTTDRTGLIHLHTPEHSHCVSLRQWLEIGERAKSVSHCRHQQTRQQNRAVVASLLELADKAVYLAAVRFIRRALSLGQRCFVFARLLLLYVLATSEVIDL